MSEKEDTGKLPTTTVIAPDCTLANKLTIFSIMRLLENIDQCKRIENTTITNSHIETCKNIFHKYIASFDSYTTNNIIIFYFIRKLFFKEISRFYGFYRHVFGVEKKLFVDRLDSNALKVTEKELRKVKINLVNYYKILLKEFNLIKLYDQFVKSCGIEKLEDVSFEIESAVEKIEKINGLLEFTDEIIMWHDKHIIEICNYIIKQSENDVLPEEVILTPVLIYISFYYWSKIINFLIKQYKETINSNELDKNINIKVFKHLSAILIILCSNRLLSVADSIAYWYLQCKNQKLVSISELEKILGKLVDTLKEVYSVLFEDVGEDNTILLCRASTYEIRYRGAYCICRNKIDAMLLNHVGINHILHPLFSRIKYKRKYSSENFERYDKILEFIYEIDSLFSLIRSKINLALNKFSKYWPFR